MLILAPLEDRGILLKPMNKDAGLKERGGGMKRGKEGEDKERREGKIGLNKGKCKRGKEGGKERGREV